MKTLTKNKYTRSKKHFKKSWNGVPATKRQTLFEVSLTESLFTSLFCHALSALLIWLLVFALMFFGLTPKLFPKPKQKTKDIEFIINGTSRHRSRHLIHKVRQNSGEQKSEPKAEPQKVNVDILSTLSDFRKKHTNKNDKTALTAKHSSNSVIPDFSASMPNLKSLSSGLGGSGKTRSNASSSNSSSSSIGDIDNAFSFDGGSSSHSGVEKNGTQKIITTYDISPYVNELKRNIRWNWNIPKGNENKRVELFLRIAKDGRLIILNVKKTSEVGDVDNAALNAVKKCLPLNPLPAKYNKGYLDVIFTFGSNSVSSKY